MAPGFPFGRVTDRLYHAAVEQRSGTLRHPATTKRLPEVKHYGDVFAINGSDLPPVDIITFGSTLSGYVHCR